MGYYINNATAVNWIAIASASNYTAIAHQHLILESGAGVVTLPASPNIGDWIEVIGNPSSAFGSRPIALNGAKFRGESLSTVYLLYGGVSVRLTYLSADEGWVPSDRLTLSSYPERLLTYSAPGDSNGLFSLLGERFPSDFLANFQTGRYTQLYNYSGATGASITGAIDKGTTFYRSPNTPDQWVGWGFYNLSVSVNRYTLRSQGTTDADHLRSWAVDGSKDSFNWELIHGESNNSTLTGLNTYYTSPVIPASKYYSWIRVRQTGLNSSARSLLTIGEFEVYGAAKFLPD